MIYFPLHILLALVNSYGALEATHLDHFEGSLVVMLCVWCTT